MSESMYVAWRKSSYSDGTGNCIEVTSADRMVAIRDARQGGHGPLLKFAESAWQRFLVETKDDMGS
jgi:hypothetical protein